MNRDIVDRLRDSQPAGTTGGYLLNDAVDEITALRARIAEQEAASQERPHAYMLAKLAMVIPLFEEARDALTAITEQQRVTHGISASLVDRMDVAGTYSVDDWRKLAQRGKGVE